MSIRIRDAVFETNSSSSHSVTVSASDMMDSTFPAEMLQAGSIEVRLGEFGWAEETYDRPLDKLSYLLTQAKGDPAATIRICAAVEEHTGCRVVIEAESREESYVDHQSQGEGLELVDDPSLLLRFLLSSNASVRTGNDNTSDYGY